MVRVASSIYEEKFDARKASDSLQKLNEPALNIIKLNNNLTSQINYNNRSKDEWVQIFETAAFFKGYDIILKDLIIMVYEDPYSTKISTVLFSCVGDFCFNSLTLDHKSRFFIACQNLEPRLRQSNTRRALAITLLKTYSGLNAGKLNNLLKTGLSFEWDETYAGELASKMTLVSSKAPGHIGKSLLSMGFLQAHYINSTIIDVVYKDSPEVIDSNNKLVHQLGEQLEHLFDLLTEYSPESTDILYSPPLIDKPANDDELVSTICDELVQLQEHTTTKIVNFLRKVVIPIRIKTLNGEIEGLTTANVNQVFPPTIDEITRINCIFLEALKAAAPYGSFEIIKACGFTIPYFYKANMRHESAIKNFSHHLKSFLSSYGQYIPEGYTERQIESILKLPLNLTKVKMILDRLVKTKNWDQSEKSTVQQYLKSSLDTIGSFGRDELKPYNRRVMTPSGKILTEICEGWPSILSHGWMNRRFISVIDTEDVFNGESGVIVLFSDFIVFATCLEDDIEYADEQTFKPRVSAVLMNSLINENPIKTIPQLRVNYYSDLNSLEVTSFQDCFIKFMFKNNDQQSLVYKTEDSDKFINVLNKAKILSKNTPFHLFRIEKFGLNIFAIAHEESNYKRENTRSPVVLFLNMTLTQDLLRQYDLFAGISARFIEEDLLKVDGLTIEGETFQHNIILSELSSFIAEEVSSLVTKRHSIQNPEYFKLATKVNKTLLTKLCTKPNETIEVLKPQPITKDTKIKSKRISLLSLKTNKSILKTKESEDSIKVPKKKKTFRNRLSKLFSKKQFDDASIKSVSKSSSKIISRNSSVRKVTSNSQTSFISSNIISKQSTPATDIFDEDVPELSNFEDNKNFESSMSPIWNDGDLIDNYTNMIQVNSNWMIARENSSMKCNLNLMTKAQLNDDKDKLARKPSSLIPLKQLPMIPQVNNQCKSPKQNTTSLQIPMGINFKQLEQPKELQKPHLFEQELKSRMNEISSSKLSNHQDFPTFNSMDNEFQSSLLKVRVPSQENLNDENVYFTPESFNTSIFNDSQVNSGLDDELIIEEQTRRNFLKRLDVFDVNYHDFNNNNNSINNNINNKNKTNINDETQPSSDSNLSFQQSFNTIQSTDTMNDLSFQSCIEIPEKQVFLKTQDFELLKDDSFRYLSKIVDNSFDINDLNSESLSLSHSFSSIKYLASYIDVDFTQELERLQEE